MNQTRIKCSRIRYKYTYKCLRFKYKYQYLRFKYKYKYFKSVLKYSSITSTSTKYNKSGMIVKESRERPQ